MALYDEIVADAPYLWYRFENASSLGDDAAESSGSIALSNTAVTSVAGRSGISDLAARFPASSAALRNTSLGSDSVARPQSTMTVEMWVKRNATSTAHKILFYRRSGGGALTVGIAPSNAASPYTPNAVYVENFGSGSTFRATGAAAVISDTTTWHHIAVTSTGTTVTLYVDGVSVGTFAAQAINTGSTGQELWIGSQATSGSTAADADIDEVAIYKSTLSQARIQAHIDAAAPPGISISVQAPATTLTTSSPAPVVTATRSNVKNTARAMTISLSARAPVINIVHPDVTNTVPAAVLNISTGPVVVKTDTKSSGTAISLNVTMGSATINTTNVLSLTPTDSISPNYAAAEGGYLEVGPTYGSYLKFPLNLASDKMVSSASLRLTRYGAQDVAVPYTVHAILSPWSEATYNDWRVNPAPTLSPAYAMGSIPAAGWMAPADIDVTEAIKHDVGYGIAIMPASAAGAIFIDSAQYRPTLTATVTHRPAEEVNVQAPAMVASISVPQHRVGSGTVIAAGTPGSATIATVAPVVSAGRNIEVDVPAMTLTQLFPGGRSVTPDVHAVVDGFVGDYYFTMPDADQYIEVPSISTVTGAMEVTLSAPSDISIDFQTDRTVKAPSAAMTIRLVGTYNAESDRYVNLVKTTVDVNDVWLPLDDVSGEVARDLAGGPGTTADNPASYYRGSPQLNISGPYLRRAVAFDGVDDYIEMIYTELFPNKVNFEFSIRTTQQNGVILSGGGGTTAPGVVVADNMAQIRLVDGKIALFPGNGTGLPSYVTSAYVADGEWHHIVINIPWMNATGFYGDAYTYVAVDGRVRWTRYTNAIGFFRPLSAMGALNIDSLGNKTVTGAIAGEMSHLVIRDQRELGQSMPVDLATKLYYEWSNATLVQPEPMVVNLSMPDPHRARGNRKRMVVLMGLPNGGFNDPANAHTEAYNYWSIFAGYYVGIEDMPGFTRTGPDINRRQYYPVAPFIMEDYICYPVVLFSEPNGSGSIQLSAEGMEKPGIRDPLSRVLIDDETGLARFINLQTDLNEPIENFDAITALNYPAEEPTWDANTWGGTQSRVGDWYEPKQFTRLTASQWKVARDKLRDSILEAAYDGVNLWINEPQMAQHLGFIQAYDKHVPGYPGQSPTKANPMADTHLTYDPNNANGVAVFNKRGDVLDAAHVKPGLAYESGPDAGNFMWIWQVNSKRVITATEPGLTDLPGAFIKDQIDYQSKDRWQPHSRITAYDVLRRENGLQIGDSFQMPMTLDPSALFGTYTVGNPRRFVVSARPEGIAGKIISREIDFYYGPNGVVVDNPFSGNVITIAAERGTVVRGRPIMGRAFIEFMSPETEQRVVNVDTDKSMWQGDTGKNISTWDFDSRRYRELVAKQIVTFTKRRISVSKQGAMVYEEDQGIREIQWYERQIQTLTMLPYMSMNARGLHWLGLTETIPAGTVRAFAAPMEVTISSPAPKLTRTGGAVTTVVGPMRVDIDLRQPKNYRGNDVREKALPMVINLSMAGIGKVVKAGPMELTLTAPQNVRGTGSGDRIFVYMDAGTDVTIYMKED